MSDKDNHLLIYKRLLFELETISKTFDDMIKLEMYYVQSYNNVINNISYYHYIIAKNLY